MTDRLIVLYHVHIWLCSLQQQSYNCQELRLHSDPVTVRTDGKRKTKFYSLIVLVNSVVAIRSVAEVSGNMATNTNYYWRFTMEDVSGPEKVTRNRPACCGTLPCQGHKTHRHSAHLLATVSDHLIAVTWVTIFANFRPSAHILSRLVHVCHSNNYLWP